MQIKRLNPDGLFNTNIFSQVVTVSNCRLVFTAGQVAWNDEGQLIGKGDFGQQAHKCLQNIKIILQSLDVTWENVIKLTTYIPQYNADYHHPHFAGIITKLY